MTRSHWLAWIGDDVVEESCVTTEEVERMALIFTNPEDVSPTWIRDRYAHEDAERVMGSAIMFSRCRHGRRLSVFCLSCACSAGKKRGPRPA